MTIVGGRVPSTRGALIRLRDILSFIRKGKDILKMKRDHIAGEMNKRLGKLRERIRVEEEIMKLYDKLYGALSIHGYDSVRSVASSVKGMKIKVDPVSVMGVLIPRATIVEEPDIRSMSIPSVRDLAEKLYETFKSALKMAETEASLERLAEEFMTTNRKVNALEKVVIPRYERLIRYIEDRLFEEALEEFVRTKFIRNAIERRRG